MFQRYGMVLEGRMPVGLRQVASVARLGEEAEIRQFKIRDDTGYLSDNWCIRLPLKKGMRKHQAKEQDAYAEQGQAKTRFSHGESRPARGNSFNQGSS
jgi:hypothetical protein